MFPYLRMRTIITTISIISSRPPPAPPAIIGIGNPLSLPSVVVVDTVVPAVVVGFVVVVVVCIVVVLVVVLVDTVEVVTPEAEKCIRYIRLPTPLECKST